MGVPQGEETKDLGENRGLRIMGDPGPRAKERSKRQTPWTWDRMHGPGARKPQGPVWGAQRQGRPRAWGGKGGAQMQR